MIHLIAAALTMTVGAYLPENGVRLGGCDVSDLAHPKPNAKVKAKRCECHYGPSETTPCPDGWWLTKGDPDQYGIRPMIIHFKAPVVAHSNKKGPPRP
jgi:hypothetical protein